MKNRVADRMGRLHTESAFQILAKANALEAKGRSIIHLEIGQPDFKTPDNIIEAAYRAMKEGKTGYGPTPGIIPLREEIVQKHLCAGSLVILLTASGIHDIGQNLSLQGGGILRVAFSPYRV